MATQIVKAAELQLGDTLVLKSGTLILFPRVVQVLDCDEASVSVSVRIAEDFVQTLISKEEDVEIINREHNKG